jgi:hypothetical protein
MNKWCRHIQVVFCLISWSFIANSQCTNYSIAVNSGSFPDEVSWFITNSANVTVASGGAPANLVECLPDGCYTIHLIDSYGDGWNGSSITITDPANIVMGSATIAYGFNKVVLLSLGGANCCPSGTTSYNMSVSAGNFPDENSWEIINSTGVIVLSGGAPDNQTVCLPPGCYSIFMYDMFSDGWDGSVFTFSQGATTIASGTLTTGDFAMQDFTVGGGSCYPTCSGTDLPYHFIVSSDDFPSEVSWTIQDENGVNILTGGSPASVYFCVHAGCYQIIMTDSYGDGWSGAYYSLYDENGVTVHSGTLENGFTETNVLEMGGMDCGVVNPVTASDCNVAVNVCENLNFLIDPNGYGTLNEMPPPGTLTNPYYDYGDGINSPWGTDHFGCLQSGELNSTWMILNIWQGGSLTFTFGGNGAQAGYYDWIMYPYDPDVTCQNIYNNTQPPVRCNWNLTSFGGTGLASVIPPGGNAGNFEPPLNVVTGQQYLICFSNYSSVVTGVPLDFGGTAVVGCGELVLPVNLISFRAHEIEEAVFLEWTTVSEINNDYFIVEHSIHGSEWNSIGVVDGNGTIQEVKKYSLLHHSPSQGKNYYRLKQVDFNGRFKISEEVFLFFSKSKSVIYPNPNEGRFLIHQNCPFSIIDVAGRIQAHQQIKLSDEVIEIILTEAKSGIYILKSNCEEHAMRIVVK